MDQPRSRKTAKSKSVKSGPEVEKEKIHREAFGAIAAFVKDLWDAFGNPKEATPLALYNRLVEHIKFTDKESIEKSVAGFSTFLGSYENDLMKNTLDNIPRDTKISYGVSGKVYIDIQKFIYQTRNDEETREILRQHLLTIGTILNPNKAKIAELERSVQPRGTGSLNLDTGTKEGQFLTKIMGKAQGAMQDVNTDDPMQAMFGIMKSGVLQDMISGIQEGIKSGEMSTQGLLGSMQSAISSMSGHVDTGKGGESKNNDPETSKKASKDISKDPESPDI